MHKKIIEKTMSGLAKDRQDYFQSIIRYLEKDPRMVEQENVVFTILKDVIPDTPTYLDADEFVDLLIDFIRYNKPGIRNLMYSRSYIHDPHVMRTITGNFIQQVVVRSFDKHEKGDIDTGDLSVHKLTWPYRDTDVLDPDDDPDEWLAAIKRSEAWKKEQKVDRRKSGLSRIDDKAMALAKEKKDKEEKEEENT